MKIDKIVYSQRKTLCIEIDKNGKIIIKSPKFLNIQRIEKFINEKKDWINKKLKQREDTIIKTGNFLKQYGKNISKQQAYKIISLKTKELSSTFNFKYATIKITNAKTRWGSCSAKNNLNFTKIVAILPEEIMDYIIIHELAHTKEKNHGKNFWEIIHDIIPDYKTRIKWLKEHQNIITLEL